MKLLVLSDSHGDVDVMENAALQVRPDLLLHLGDHYADMERLQERLPQLSCIGVRGNCDRPGPPESRLLKLEGKRILLTHGHLQDVKYELDRLYFFGMKNEADLVLFGHSHRVCRREEAGMQLLNPGSIGQGWPPSYAIVQLEGGRIDTEIVMLG